MPNQHTTGLPGDTLYRILKAALDVTVWGGQLVGDAGPQGGQPAVFVANHAGAIGPIGIAASMPVRLHPWVVGDMLDDAKAGAYLLKDFVKPTLHMPDGVAGPFAAMLSRVTVRMLRRLGCVAVWNDRSLMETYRLSEDLLEAGRSLLIFPEDSDLPVNPATNLHPFQTGFAHLGAVHHERTGRSLSFRPIAVNTGRRTVMLGEPVHYNINAEHAGERRRIASVLESMIIGMLAEDNGLLGLGVRAHR
jgi:hypothetical protein